ncbi:helix-turn-helix domain-containing protein [Gulosibacter chungangensis]|uniref:ImmA/IrrE family metallo-endopeptidase n=1 Tax=Gulosibacter chungangensis TaxID=979746 RepID=A0A7J5B9W3_9MICO|nr:XRE family transcriptional regulator [Gulosibacter chungangensis]KAB1642548.1 ImmA/IrrE family metallo-endopeptidase [Gulosibacter chungangensis]
MNTIGERVRAALERDGRTQNEVASEVGIAPDAFSRAINGKRGFGALELADIARALGVSVHWLITGERDPFELVLSARHETKPGTFDRRVSGAVADESVLTNIALAYHQCGDQIESTSLPESLAELTEDLDGDFVPRFIEQIETLGIDVIRVEQLSTAYSFQIDGRAVIALNSSGNWFHQNWSVAHELGHLIMKHENVMPGNGDVGRLEAEANRFAAELLLPGSEMKLIDWATISKAEVADFLWDRGVSAAALSLRLQKLDLCISDEIVELLSQKTQGVIRRHSTEASSADINARMVGSTERKFPSWLIGAHVSAIAAGKVGKATLAWMLDVDVAGLDVEEPESPDLLSANDLIELFG